MIRSKDLSAILLSVFGMIVLHYSSYSPYGEFAHNVAIASSFFVFLSLFFLMYYREMKYVFILPFIALNWVYFLSPFLLKEKTEYFMRIIREEYIGEIATYCGLSIALIFIGYHYFFNRSVRPLTSINYNFSQPQLQSLIKAFIFLSVMYRLGVRFLPSVTLQLSNIIQLLFYAPTIALSLYVLYLLRSNEHFILNRFHIISIGFILVEFVLRVSTTLFATVIVFLIGAVIVYFREKRKLPLIAIGLSVLLLYPIYEARKYYRFLDTENVSGAFDKGFLVVEEVYLNQDKFSESIDQFEESQYNEKHNRFENLSFISHVVLQHKQGVKPFLNGETFYWLPLVPIPRIIFPSKPDNVMSTEVATAYGLRGKVSNASINFPMLVEGYINFDFKGMLLMALLFGMSYKWFAMKFGAGLGDINLLIMLNSFKQFTHAEGNITLVFGALIQVLLFWAVIVWFFKLNENRSNQLAANNL
ncbi:hypothetical protein GYB57_10460 [bacterium]|nr:hypothetical protein [bacterium]